MPIIGVDYTPAYEQGAGIGRLVRQLVSALARIDRENDYRLFVAGARTKQLPLAIGNNFQWRATPISPKWLARLWHRAHLPLAVEYFTGPLDIYHATDFVLPPTYKNTITLVTVHDLSFVHVPETTPPTLKAYLDRVVPYSVRRANHVIADSQATKTDLMTIYQIASEKISVLYSGVEPIFRPIKDPNEINAVRQKYHIGSKPYLLSVGTIQPRKNYVRIVQALHILRSAGYDVELVIAGGKGWLNEPFYQIIRDKKLNDAVHLIGYADDTDLPALYSGALMTLFPSLYEGFGFPVLEAMACGTPVITSNISSLPEVAGQAAILINPYDIEALAQAIITLIEDSAYREKLIKAGYSQAQKFTWERAAHQLAQIYATISLHPS